MGSAEPEVLEEEEVMVGSVALGDDVMEVLAVEEAILVVICSSFQS